MADDRRPRAEEVRAYIESVARTRVADVVLQTAFTLSSVASARLGVAPETQGSATWARCARRSTRSWRCSRCCRPPGPEEFAQLRQTLAGLQMAYGQVAQETGEGPPPPPPRQEHQQQPRLRRRGPSRPGRRSGRREATSEPPPRRRVIGDSGFYRFLGTADEVAVATPYGPPRRDRGRRGRRVATRSCRATAARTMPPHTAPYRATSGPCASLGVRRSWACASGSLRVTSPGAFVSATVRRSHFRPQPHFYDGPQPRTSRR
jgi:hypothetical protein